MNIIARFGLIWMVVAGLAFGLVAWKAADHYASRVSGHGSAAPAAAANVEPVIIAGFRTAMFGDDEAAVRAAIARDFGKDTKIVTGASPTEKTELLAIHAKDVIPGSGLAEIVYIFGFKTKALIQVNIVWGSLVSPDVSVEQLGTTAAILKQYFMGRGFAPASVVHDKSLPSGALVVFSGADAGGRVVRLMYQEAVVDTKDTKPETKSEKKPVRKIIALRLSYIKDATTPDIYTIEKGQF
jgi:hypothetical protein